MSAKLPTKEEELCHLENGLKNKKWLYIGCIQEMFYEDGIREFIVIAIFWSIIFGILYYYGAISFSILFIFIVIKIIIYLITHNQQVNPINEINFTHKCQEN